MDIQIYTTVGCSYCEKIKELMRRAELEYKTILVGKDISKEEFKTNYSSARGFPYVIIDDKPIGGLVETVKLFVEKGLVSSKKR